MRRPEVEFCSTTLVYDYDYTSSRERFYEEEVPAGRCWLCERASPHARFKKRAHVVPQSLGNRGWLTYDECDDCNELSGRHESALVASLAPYRVTSNATAGRPKFKDPKSGSFIWSVGQGNDVFISEKLKTGGLAEILSDTTMIVRVPVDAYKPLSICKALARIALVLFPELRTSHDFLRSWILGSRVLSEQVLVVGESRNGETLGPWLRIMEHPDGASLAVVLSYGGAIYWYALPSGPDVSPRVFIEETMIEPLLELKWQVRLLNETSLSRAGHVTLTLVRDAPP